MSGPIPGLAAGFQSPPALALAGIGSAGGFGLASPVLPVAGPAPTAGPMPAALPGDLETVLLRALAARWTPAADKSQTPSALTALLAALSGSGPCDPSAARMRADVEDLNRKIDAEINKLRDETSSTDKKLSLAVDNLDKEVEGIQGQLKVMTPAEAKTKIDQHDRDIATLQALLKPLSPAEAKSTIDKLAKDISAVQEQLKTLPPADAKTKIDKIRSDLDGLLQNKKLQDVIK